MSRKYEHLSDERLDRSIARLEAGLRRAEAPPIAEDEAALAEGRRLIDEARREIARRQGKSDPRLRSRQSGGEG